MMNFADSKMFFFSPKFHAAGDALMPHEWISTFFTPDAVVRFGNVPAISGRDAMLEFFEPFMAGLERMRHE